MEPRAIVAKSCIIYQIIQCVCFLLFLLSRSTMVHVIRWSN